MNAFLGIALALLHDRPPQMVETDNDYRLSLIITSDVVIGRDLPERLLEDLCRERQTGMLVIEFRPEYSFEQELCLGERYQPELHDVVFAGGRDTIYCGRDPFNWRERRHQPPRVLGRPPDRGYTVPFHRHRQMEARR